MRIALYFQSLARPGGGAERMIVALAGALARRGHDVALFSWDSPEAAGFYAMDPAVSWHRLGFAPGWRGKLRRCLALARALRAMRAQTLIGFVMSGDGTVFAAARLAGVEVCAAERNGPTMYELLYTPRRRRMNFLLLGSARHIVVQFPRYAQGYPERLRDRIVSIANPVTLPPKDEMAGPETAGPDGRYRLLCVSRLDETQKQIGVLIGAFAAVAQRFPEWDLVVLGDGPGRERYAAWIAAEGLEGRIRLEGSTPDVGSFYRAAQLFVIPSAWEGFPNALAEALAHGLPAVGYADADGVADLIGTSGGWLAKRRGQEMLAAALEAAMSDPAERMRRGLAARERMRDYEPDAIWKRWENLLTELQGEGRD